MGPLNSPQKIAKMFSSLSWPSSNPYLLGSPTPSLPEAKLTGSFSLGERRTFHPDRSQMKFLRQPQSDGVNWDLNRGIDKVERKAEEEFRKEGLTWMSNKE